MMSIISSVLESYGNEGLPFGFQSQQVFAALCGGRRCIGYFLRGEGHRDGFE